jgi:hypothetical protein
MAQSIVKVLNFFDSLKGPRKDFLKYEGRFMSLFDVGDVIAANDKLIYAFPSWEPFENPDELKLVRGNVFKVSKTNSFGSEGEEVSFKLNKAGKVESINYAGSTMLPEKAYLRETMKNKKIGLRNG